MGTENTKFRQSYNTMKYLCILLLLFASCRSEKNSNKEFFSGMFVCHADKASLTDCATGMTVPISDENAYPSLEKRYFLTMPDPQEAVYVEFRGRMERQPKEDGSGLEDIIVVDSLITLDPTQRCDYQTLLVGVYEAKTNNGRCLLRLKPNYEFTETRFVTGQENMQEQTSSGRWWRSAELELILEETSPDTAEQSFQMIPSRETLTRNSGGGPMVYKKVYL